MALQFRQAVRALLLDPDRHVLLARYEFPTATVWALPGGGLDDGETDEQGLRRELHEELGLDDFDLGAHIWNREHVFPMTTGHDGQHDRIHLVRIDRFEPEPTIGWDRMRAEFVHELRWWSVSAIDAATSTRFAPTTLGRLVTDLLDDGIPPHPVDVGV